MEEITRFLKDKKNLTNLLVLSVLILALPVGVILIRQQQFLQSRAVEKPVQVIEGKCVVQRGGKPVLVCADVPLKLVSPIGAPEPSGSATATPSASSTALPAACNSATKMADGRPVVSVSSFNNNIQAALDCFKEPASGGGAVYIPAGSYDISKKIRVYSNTTLFGDGIDRTILSATPQFQSGQEAMISNDSSGGLQNVFIREMTLNGGLSASADKLNGNDGIKFRDLYSGYIANVKVMQFGDHGIWLSYKPTNTDPGYKAVYNVRVTNCQSLRNKGAGIWIDSGERNVVDNCTVSAEGDANGIGFEIGIDGKLSNNMMVSNDIQRNGHGITLTAGNFDNYSPGMINSNNIVCYNIVKNNRGPGVWDQKGKDNVYIGNDIDHNNNNDGNKRVINVNSFGYEEKLPPATDARCEIPASYTIPPAPPKPVSMNNPGRGLIKEAFADTGALTTVSFKIAESAIGLRDAPAQDYIADPMVLNYTLKDKNPGMKQIWVEFIGSDGQSKTRNTTVELAEEDPVIESVACKYDISREAVLFEAKGKRFGLGQKDSRLVTGAMLKILKWDKEKVSGILEAPVAKTSQVYDIQLLRDDGQVSNVIPCEIGITQVSLGAQAFCRTEGKFEASGVKVTIVDSEGKKVDGVANINKSGLLQKLETALEIGKHYTVYIKAPYTLRRKGIFTAEEGTSVISTAEGENFILPVGDIFPRDGGDGVINSADRAELNRQWGEAKSDTERSGDFNRDKRVNTFDWACMRYDFGGRDEQIE